jgi:PBP1b-binding outer membrane lipoprotein LpoB
MFKNLIAVSLFALLGTGCSMVQKTKEYFGDKQTTEKVEKKAPVVEKTEEIIEESLQPRTEINSNAKSSSFSTVQEVDGDRVKVNSIRESAEEALQLIK